MKGCLLGSQAGVAAGSLNKKWARMRRQVKKEQRCLNESLSGARQHGALLALSAREPCGGLATELVAFLIFANEARLNNCLSVFLCL